MSEDKKDFKVSKRGLEDCLKDWDPQTQMSKEEWKESCRATLEYMPEPDIAWSIELLFRCARRSRR